VATKTKCRRALGFRNNFGEYFAGHRHMVLSNDILRNKTQQNFQAMVPGLAEGSNLVRVILRRSTKFVAVIATELHNLWQIQKLTSTKLLSLR
jgi:hypothetical protein